jgi:hypothetical protein
LASTLSIGIRLFSLVGDDVALDERVGQLGRGRGFPFHRPQETIYRGWIEVKNGDLAEDISLMRSGSSAYRATGAET